MDLLTEIHKRLTHDPGCPRRRLDFHTLEPSIRPGVIIVSADCGTCDASIFEVELAVDPAPRRTHLDSDGIERTGNQWGFNSFTTHEGALKSVRGFGRKGTTWYIWLLSDGTFEWTSSSAPTFPWHPAKLVEKVEL